MPDDDYPATYEDLVARWGYEVLDFGTFGDYQGDHTVLLRNGEQYGWAIIGYGSCSGCDALEGAWDDWTGQGGTLADRVERLSEELKSSIRWDSPASLAAWLTDEELQEQGWSWHEDGYREHVTAVVDRLRSLETAS